MQWLLTFILHRLSTMNYACSILFSLSSYEKSLLVLHNWWLNVSKSYFLTRTLCFMIIWLSSRYITCHLNSKQSKNHLCSRWGIIYFHLYSHEDWPLFEHSIFYAYEWGFSHEQNEKIYGAFMLFPLMMWLYHINNTPTHAKHANKVSLNI